MSKARPKLFLGWIYGESRTLGGKTDPLQINFKHLRNHSVIVAQSGSGKSNLVARVVEEIVLKTQARVVVVDTNADFRKSHLVSDDDRIWNDELRNNVGLSYEDYLEAWNRKSKMHLTNGELRRSNLLLDPESADNDVRWEVPYISWNKLSRIWQTEVLGLELSRNLDEVAAFYRVADRLATDDEFLSPAIVEDELSLLARTQTFANRPDERAAISLQMRCRQATKLDFWRTSKNQLDLTECLRESAQLLVLDIPAIANGNRPSGENGNQASGYDPKRALILVGYLLDVLWELARSKWDEVVSGVSKRQLSPTFLVIDEAHNFVPDDDLRDPLANRVSTMIQRIAAEGRKYGLFVLLVTQRPQKVKLRLISECENLCLLRLQSPHDLDFAKKIWGFEPLPDLMPAAFAKGQGLLAGPWSNGEAEEPPPRPQLRYFEGGRRRTVETGGDIGDDWIVTEAKGMRDSD